MIRNNRLIFGLLVFWFICRPSLVWFISFGFSAARLLVYLPSFRAAYKLLLDPCWPVFQPTSCLGTSTFSRAVGQGWGWG